jgi:hypothetical protein
MEWLGQTLGVKKVEDWYNVNESDVKSKDIARILQVSFGGSLLRGIYLSHLRYLSFIALTTLFPEHKWESRKLYRFESFWTDIHRQKEFFVHLTEQLGIRDPTDWYNIDLKDIHDKGGSKLLEYLDVVLSST